MLKFNTTGPCFPDEHYMLPALDRIPKSIALVGMLDVRDYKAQIRPDGSSLGEISPFNDSM